MSATVTVVQHIGSMYKIKVTGIDTLPGTGWIAPARVTVLIKSGYIQLSTVNPGEVATDKRFLEDKPCLMPKRQANTIAGYIKKMLIEAGV
jgi:hypothetical protein